MQNKAALPVSNQEMRYSILLALLLAGTTVLPAADFKGATEVLRQAAQASPKPQEKSKDPQAPFRDRLKAFQSQSTNLPPAQVATQWLALVDDFGKQTMAQIVLTIFQGAAKRRPANRPPGSHLHRVYSRTKEEDHVLDV